MIYKRIQILHKYNFFSVYDISVYCLFFIWFCLLSEEIFWHYSRRLWIKNSSNLHSNISSSSRYRLFFPLWKSLNSFTVFHKPIKIWKEARIQSLILPSETFLSRKLSKNKHKNFENIYCRILLFFVKYINTIINIYSLRFNDNVFYIETKDKNSILKLKI